jgi:hypothetical protein
MLCEIGWDPKDDEGPEPQEPPWDERDDLRLAMDLVSADLNRLLADEPEGTIIKLAGQQLDGMACARCGTPAVKFDEAAGKIVRPPMVPVSDGGVLFICAPDCRR